jgi:hypothetical protein
MARPIIRRVFLKYSGDARYLEFLIKELQSQYDKSVTFDTSKHTYTAEAKVELNIPDLTIEWEPNTWPVLEA